MIKKYTLHLLILLGSLSWILTMIKNGLSTPWGLGFWGANGHDGIWHLALASSLSRGSLLSPTFAGHPIQNYHIGFDLFLGLLSKSGIPISVLYFQILPIVFALAIGILTYLVVTEWTRSKVSGIWAVFFVYFGGSFGYIVTLLRGQGISGESLFWSQQSISTLINPPFALSLVLLLSGLLVYIKRQKNWFLVSGIIFSLLLSIKVYAGILVLGSFLILSLYSMFIKKQKTTITFFVFILFTSLILFLPLNKSSSSLVVFQPGWFLETMLSISDRFYWPKLFEAIINWRAGHVYVKAVVGYLVAFILFMVGNIGTRIVSVYLIKPKKFSFKSITDIDILLGAIFFGGVLAPMLFLQAGTAWNTIQFFYYSLFVLSLYSGIAVSQILKKLKFTHAFVACLSLILLTIPTTFSTLSQVYLPGRPPAKLSLYEVEALSFLSKQPDGVVLTYPFDKLKADEAIVNPPRPLYLYESTAYVSAFGNHPVFLEDEVNLTIMNYQWKQRREDIDDFYKSTDQKLVYDYLRANDITYIYWVKPQFTQIGDLQLKLENIFENKEVIIYKVI